MGESNDHIVDEVVDKVTHHQATPDDPDEVRDQVQESVDGLVDEPVQTFTPLLAENEVVNEYTQDRGQDDDTAS